MLKIVTWRKTAKTLPNDISNYVCPVTVEEILKRILLESQSGEIPPPDPSTLHILRCLSYALKSDFTYDTPLRRIFPSNDEFREALRENGQLPVFDSIQDIVDQLLGRRPLIAQTHHTSIGIPFIQGADRERSNTLCRIQTVDSFYNPETRDGIYIELSERAGWTEGKVSKLFSDYPELTRGRPGLTFALQEGTQYHNNGKNNERVFVVCVSAERPENAKSTEATNQLMAFFTEIRKQFAEKHGRTL